MSSPGALMQVVDAVGEFKSQEVEQFVAEHHIAELRQNYQVVAIMGPQSSGKSTLLNHLVRGQAGQEIQGSWRMA